MRELAPEDSWSAQGESQLRETLYAAGLRFTYNRPHVVLARRAVFYVIAELADAGVIELRNLRRLEPVLRFHDPAMIVTDPSPRPLAISPITIENRLGVNSEWLTQINGVLNQARWKIPDGRIILAEETTLKRLEREEPTETRRITMCLSSTPELTSDDRDDSFFETLINHYVTEYPRLRVNADPVPMVLRHTPFYYNSPGKRWLALNPTVGYKLGWILAAENLFKWVDSSGQIMVESVWWTDGLLDRTIPYSHNEVGEGWLVLATPKAFEQLREYYHPLKRLTMVRREYYDDEQGLMQESALKQSLLEP
jgi:hypothetical protein